MMTGCVAVLRFLANDHARWVLSAGASLASILFFFQIDRPLTALLAALVSFAALPAGVMARSMLARGLPRAPVASGMIGLMLGLAAGAVLALTAWKIGAPGIAGAVAALIVTPITGFLLFGGVANVIGSTRPPGAG